MKPLAEFVRMNGRVTTRADARVHVMIHTLRYGTSVFKSNRVYDIPRQKRVRPSISMSANRASATALTRRAS